MDTIHSFHTIDTIKSAHAIPLSSFSAEGAVPEWIHVMPSGTFAGRDGRGPYTLGDAAVVIERTLAKAAAQGVPMDYDHQLENAPKNGAPAPASGWIKELAARPDGIWARVEWTDRAAAHIAAREYRYVSPVFYHAKTGEIRLIESVALTNLPNLPLKSIARRGDPAKDDAMRNALASLLGLADDAPETALEAAVRTVAAERDALKIALADVGKAVNCQGALPDLVKAVATVAAQATAPDPAKYVPIDAYTAASRELSELKSAQARNAAETLVEDAHKNGRVSPAMRSWAKTYATKDPEGFKAWAALAPDMRPGGEEKASVTNKNPGASGASGGLTEEEKAVAAACGLDEDTFKKGRS